MKMKSAMAILAAAGAAATASGAVPIRNIGFEAAEGYVAPANLAGQQTWQEFTNVGGTLLNTKFAVQNTAGKAFAGTQYVEGQTANWGTSSTSFTSGLKYRIAWVDSPIAPALLAANPIIHLSTAIRVGSNTATTRNSFAGLAAYGYVDPASTPATVLEVQVRTTTAAPTTGQIVVFNATAGIGFAGTSFSGSALDRYIVIDEYLNYTTGLFSVIVDGISLDASLDSAGFSRAFDTTLVFDEADLTGYRVKGSTGGDVGGHELRYDNYLIELLPAPSSVALMGLGGLLAARRRRA